MKNEESFNSCLYAFDGNLKRILSFINDFEKSQIQEIRIRVQKPLAVTKNSKTYYVTNNSLITNTVSKDCYVCSKQDVDNTYILITKRSVFAHTKELSNGFIRMDFGHRAGVCGDFSESGIINNVSSINIRIARQIIGCANYIFENFDNKGMLILGPPGSGKTTMLRDLIRQISNSGLRVAVIDSRGEISASSYGISNNDLGVNTDVLIHSKRAMAIEIAVRTLFPNVICFDEIGNSAELDAVSECFNCGATIITTAHIGNIKEIYKRPVTDNLIKMGVIENIVIMNNDITVKPKLIKIGEILK